MRPPLSQPITLDFEQVWLMHTARGRALLDVLSSGEISALLAGKVDWSDPRIFGPRFPKVHGAEAHDSTVEATANKGVAGGYCELDSGAQVPTTRLGSGTPDATKVLRGDRTWASPSATGVVPVGAVVAWLKSLTGAPALAAEFVECNGQTISDAASPLNGQTIPNLNGNHQFLRGNSTSGGTGGASTHVHLYSGSTDVEDGDTDVQSDSGSPATVAALGHVHTYGGTTDATSSLPPYTDVVWIIRIK